MSADKYPVRMATRARLSSTRCVPRPGRGGAGGGSGGGVAPATPCPGPGGCERDGRVHGRVVASIPLATGFKR